MNGRTKKGLKKLICAGMATLALAGCAREVRAELIFENIPVTTAPGNQLRPAIWGNYIVWMGAENEAYDIAQGQIVQMPGLNIDGVPAVWENKVVWSDANSYYDIDLQQMVYPEGLSVGEWPAIHDNKIVWSDSTGYYDLSLGEMIHPPGLSIGDDPDIFGDKIVWDESTDYYYDIGLQQMVYPEGLFIYGHPAIYGNKIVSSRSSGYYDLDLGQYIFVRVPLGEEPDIFEDSIVGHNYDAVPPITIDVKIWDPVCGRRWVTESGCAAGTKIYNDIVVWTDWRNGNGDIYMARIVGCGASVGQIIYVDADATGANNGSSWTDAYNYLQDALTVSSSGGEIWVAQGIYKPDQEVGITPGDRTATFQLINGVTLRGGYAGCAEPDPNQRDIELYETILSGDLDGNDVGEIYDSSKNENSYHVVTGSGTDETAVLDGFAITGGNAYAFSAPSRKGGGMINENGSPTLTNCTFSKNKAWAGGGIYNENSSPMVTNCTFRGNAAPYNGGGISCAYNSSPIIKNSIIEGNWANRGGGIYCGGSSLIIQNNVIRDNRVSWGPIGFQGFGGGIYCSYSSAIITDNVIAHNSARLTGGGIFSRRSVLILCNNIIAANEALSDFGPVPIPGVGGGIFCTSSYVTIINNTIVGNRAQDYFGPWGQAPGEGGGIWCRNNSKLTLLNSLLWNNRPDEISSDAQSTVQVAYSDIRGGWLGGGNIDVDPCFAEPGYWDPNGTPTDANDDFWVDGDYHLLTDSPCIDAGDPNYVAEPNETDLDGRPRIIGGRIDMGAFEYSPAIPAEVRIVPRTINLASKGKWITCYIWLGEDYNVADIDANSVLLEGEIEAKSLQVDEQQQIVIVRFSRSEVQGILVPGEVELTVSGELTDGTVFEGTDAIRVIDKGSRK